MTGPSQGGGSRIGDDHSIAGVNERGIVDDHSIAGVQKLAPDLAQSDPDAGDAETPPPAGD